MNTESSPKRIKNYGFKLDAQDRNMLIITILVAIGYFIYSLSNKYFYQQDEAAHFVSMKGFWHNPNSILSNWAKTGYKLIFVIPSLFGETFVSFVNSLFAAFTAFFTYKILKTQNSRFPVLGFILLATQPMWVVMSFRNYAEISTAFILVLAVLFHYKDRREWAILLLSYSCLIRQELYILLALYGIYIVIKKDFKAVLFAAIPQLFITLWGYLAQGHFLYILKTVADSSSEISEAYPRQGFWHYPKFAVVIFGAFVVLYFISYLTERIVHRKKVHGTIFIPAVLFFVMYMIFNTKSLDFGPATAGTLRYMTVVAPFFALMSVFFIDTLAEKRKKIIYIIIGAGLALVSAIYTSFEHNYMQFSEVHDYSSVVFIVIGIGIILLPIHKMKASTLIGIITVASLLNLGFAFPENKRGEEDLAMEKLAGWYEKEVKKARYFSDQNPILSSHIMFLYFQGKTSFDFNPPTKGVDSRYISDTPPGTLIFWDSHYSYRPNLNPNSLSLDYFQKRAYEYSLIKRVKAAHNNPFFVNVYMKIHPTDSLFTMALDKFEQQQYEPSMNLIQTILSKDPKNFSAMLYLGLNLQQLQRYQEAMNAFNGAIALNDKFAPGYINRGVLLAAFNQNEQAFADVNKAIELDLDNDQFLNIRGTLYFNSGELKSAQDDFVRALNINSRNGSAYYYLGMILVKQGNAQSACTYFQNALSLGFGQAANALTTYCGQ